MTPQQVDAYLERIAYAGSREPSLAVLRALHLAHLRQVPFENLDIPLGRPISLEPDALWAKLIVARRGGFCYEQGTLFGRLLAALGFRVAWLSARVWTGSAWGPPEDHMALRVELEDRAQLADVGFGDSFRTPLELVPDVEQSDGFGVYRLRREGPRWLLEVREASGGFRPSYDFELEPRTPSEFAAMCEYQQTSPASTFTRRVVASRASERGRVTVTHARRIVTRAGVREETPLADANAVQQARHRARHRARARRGPADRRVGRGAGRAFVAIRPGRSTSSSSRRRCCP